MARSSAATVVPPPPRQRKATTKKRNPHASTQTSRRPERRTSGPARGRTSATARKRPVAAAARARTTASRRAPQPRRSAQTTTARPRRRPGAAPLIERLTHGRSGAVLDRLLRGRACVGVVFVLLVGIVFFNVALLQLNDGIAQTNAKATALEQENAKLRRDLAPLASSERIQREAVKRGYSLPAAGDVGFISGAATHNAKVAVERMTAPGTGEGTASRPAAQVEQETTAATEPTTATTPPATAPSATAPPSDQAVPPAAVAP